MGSKKIFVFTFISLVLFVMGSCKKDIQEDGSTTANQGYMKAVGLEFKSITDFSKSSTTTFEASTVKATLSKDATGTKYLTIQGLTSQGYASTNIEIQIPYTGLGSYSTSTTGLFINYSQAGFFYSTRNHAYAGGYVEVLKKESNFVEGTFRYVAYSTQTDANPKIVGHDDGVFRAKLE